MLSITKKLMNGTVKISKKNKNDNLNNLFNELPKQVKIPIGENIVITDLLYEVDKLGFRSLVKARLNNQVGCYVYVDKNGKLKLLKAGKCIVEDIGYGHRLFGKRYYEANLICGNVDNISTTFKLENVLINTNGGILKLSEGDVMITGIGPLSQFKRGINEYTIGRNKYAIVSIGEGKSKKQILISKDFKPAKTNLGHYISDLVEVSKIKNQSIYQVEVYRTLYDTNTVSYFVNGDLEKISIYDKGLEVVSIKELIDRSSGEKTYKGIVKLYNNNENSNHYKQLNLDLENLDIKKDDFEEFQIQGDSVYQTRKIINGKKELLFLNSYYKDEVCLTDNEGNKIKKLEETAEPLVYIAYLENNEKKALSSGDIFIREY